MSDATRLTLTEVAERLREIGQRTPWWHPGEHDGRAVVIEGVPGSAGPVLMEITGGWTPDLVRFFEHVNTSVITGVAELLWVIGATGDVHRIRSTAKHLAMALDVDRRHRPSSAPAVPPRSRDK